MASEEFERAKRDYEAGDLTRKFIDPTYGLRSYADVLKPGTLEYRVFGAGANEVNTNLQQAQNMYKQATGQDLSGTGLATVTSHLQAGNTVDQALSNLGNLQNFARFTTPTPPAEVPEVSATPQRPKTSQFAAQFQAQNGRPPTQQELLGYVNGGQTQSSAMQAVPDALASFRGGNATSSSIVDYLSSLGKPTDFQSRTALAQQAGIQNYTGTAAQNTQLLNLLRTAPQTTSITPDKMTGTVPNITLPSGTGTDIAATADAVVASAAQAGKTFQDYYKEQLQPPTPTDLEAKSLRDQLTSIIGEEGNRTADQLAAEKAAGIGEKQAELSDISSQIQAKQVEFEAFKQAQQGKPITMASISGSIAQEQGRIASEILLLQARGDILVGRLNSAQANVDRSIDLKYAALDNRHKLYAAQLEALKPTLDREERARVTALEQMNNDRQQALADLKAEEKSIQGVMLEAIKAGITDKNVLDSISSAKSYNDAIVAFGKDYKKEEKTEIREIGNRTYLINSQTGEKIKDLGYSGPTGGEETKEEKEIANFRANAADLILKLDSGEINWGSAFDNLRIKYPQATNDTINGILGGGIPFNSETGEFDTKGAFGRAKK